MRSIDGIDTNMGMKSAELQDRFWREPPTMPRGVTLVRQDTLVVPQRGPGGLVTYDLAWVQVPSGRVPVLVAFRPTLVPADVPRLKALLLGLGDSLRLRESLRHPASASRTPLLVTEVASAGVMDRCEREGVALVDLNGTLLLQSETAFIRTEGKGLHRRASRAPVFHGKGARIVRLLLSNDTTHRWSVRQLAQQADTSYAYAHGVVQRLEEGGYLARLKQPASLRLRDPVGLLHAWLDSGQRTAVSVQGFYAPSTTSESLTRGAHALTALGMRSIFSLGSALFPDERIATSLPHGIFITGSLAPVVEAFGLRGTQPHNFLVLRAEPAAETEAGGVYTLPRRLPHGFGVALPQLALDFWHSGGRGREQAEELVALYAQSLPLAEETPG